MAIVEIKRHKDGSIPTAILSAGISYKMKSYEPRSLLKISSDTLIETQIKTLRHTLDGDIILVIGYKANKIIRKVCSIPNVRIIENQRFEVTNAAESIRLAVNNNPFGSMLIMHGDIVFNVETLKDLNYNKSFLVIDKNKQIVEREVGVTVINNSASVLSYDLPTKWCQIAYLCGKEYTYLKSICRKDNNNIEGKLFFELINMIINKGGNFLCVEPQKMKIFEIDSMSDLYENTNS